jgi:CBS domain-containing protein
MDAIHRTDANRAVDYRMGAAMKNEPISSVMQARVQSVSMDDTVADVEAVLAREGLSWAPVVGDGGGVLAVISEADLTRYRAQNGDPAAPIWRQCTFRPLSVSPETPVSTVARLMVERRIHHVIVRDDEGVRGVVSSLDLLRLMAGDQRMPVESKR